MLSSVGSANNSHTERDNASQKNFHLHEMPTNMDAFNDILRLKNFSKINEKKKQSTLIIVHLLIVSSSLVITGLLLIVHNIPQDVD